MAVLFALVVFVFDATTIGYFHALLTEYVAVTAWLVALVALESHHESLVFGAPLRRLVPIVGIMAAISVFLYHLKQPYVGMTLGLLLASGCVAALRAGWRGLVRGLATLIAVALIVVMSVVMWNGWLPERRAADYPKTASGLLARLPLHGTYYLRPGPSVAAFMADESNSAELQPDLRAEVLALRTASTAIQECSRVWNAVDNGRLFNRILVSCPRGQPSIFDSMNAILRFWWAHPSRMVKGYFAVLGRLGGRSRASETEESNSLPLSTAFHTRLHSWTAV